MLMTILLCIHYSYFGSTISPLATVRQSLATMAGPTDDYAVIPEEQDPIVPGVTIGRSNTIHIASSTTDPPYPRLKARPPQPPQRQVPMGIGPDHPQFADM
eukprot:1900835-Amphidinium_carterae.1